MNDYQQTLPDSLVVECVNPTGFDDILEHGWVYELVSRPTPDSIVILLDDGTELLCCASRFK